MRLVLIGPVYPYRGGIAHYTTMLCQMLREYGHEVLLISFKRQYPQWLFPGQSDRDPSEHPIMIEDVHYWLDSLNPFTWLLVLYKIYRFDADVIILQWWTTFWSLAWIVIGGGCRLLQKPLLFLCHNVLPHETHWWDVLLTRVVLRCGSHFIVHSSDEKERLLDLLSSSQVSFVPMPIYNIFYDKNLPRESSRQKLGLPLGSPIVLFFGIVRKYKGLSDLLEAMARVREEIVDIKLIVAGEFWDDKRAYLNLVEQLALDKIVLFEDRYIPNEEVPLYFSAANVLVAPYRHVTGSAVVKLAMAVACPVIATDVGDLRDIIQDGDNGVLVGSSDPCALATALVRYFVEGKEESMREAMLRGRDKFTWLALLQAIEGFDYA